MPANSHGKDPLVGSQPESTWAHSWHLWKVILPRRSITGRLVWGTVWRRIGGRRWIYKRFIESSNDGSA
jgi:hypothetical protein